MFRWRSAEAPCWVLALGLVSSEDEADARLVSAEVPNSGPCQASLCKPHYHESQKKKTYMYTTETHLDVLEHDVARPLGHVAQQGEEVGKRLGAVVLGVQPARQTGRGVGLRGRSKTVITLSEGG